MNQLFRWQLADKSSESSVQITIESPILESVEKGLHLPPATRYEQHLTCSAYPFQAPGFFPSFDMEGEEILGNAQGTGNLAAVFRHKNARRLRYARREHKPIFGAFNDCIPSTCCVRVFMKCRSASFRSNNWDEVRLSLLSICHRDRNAFVYCHNKKKKTSLTEPTVGRPLLTK
jgi:hypothetical protein